MYHAPEYYRRWKRDAKEYFLPKRFALQGKFTAEALELADPVEDLEDAWHHDTRQRQSKPIVVPVFVVGV